MPGCFVKNCSSRWRKKDSDVTMHVFPRDLEQIKKWLFQLNEDVDRIDELSVKIKESTKGSYRICQRHFTDESYEQRGFMTFLRKDAMPTLFLDEEGLPEHAYAKRRRTEGESAEKAIELPNPEGSVFPQFAHPSTSHDQCEAIPSHLYFSPGQPTDSAFFPLIDVQVTEEVETSSGIPLSSQEAFVQSIHKQMRKKRVRHSRNAGTVKECFPGQANKHTQFDKSMGAKNKNIQVFRRPFHRSVAIQCTLVDLPLLSKGEVSTQNLESGRAGSMSTASEMGQLEMLVENHESNEHKGMGEIYESTEDEEELEDEQDFLRVTEKEETNVDPDNIDNSCIYIPERKGPLSHVEENKFIVFESCLDKLLMSCKCLATKTCPGTVLRIQKYRIGSAVSVIAFCSLKHRYHLWSSQPVIGKMPVGNLLISAGILCSGSHFQNVESLFRAIGILGICQRTHHINQTAFLYPTISHHWQLERSQTIRKCLNQPVALVGDAQFSSSEYSGKQCIYSFLDHGTKKIIDFQIEKLGIGTSLAGLEIKTFKISLERLLAEQMNIRVVCTARHNAIRRFLKRYHGRIQHRFDTWHIAKSVGNKLAIMSRNANCAQLAFWVAPVKRHLWWAASTCHHNPRTLWKKWVSIIYHVANQHQWQDDSVYKKCHHKQLSKEEEGVIEWLEPGSAAHQILKDVVTNNKLMKDLDQLSHFCHSAELEVFRSIASKYCSRRSHYCLDEMVARTQLAALEHNYNINRMKTMVKRLSTYEDGIYGYKAKKDWVEKIYEPTNQAFLKRILADVLDVASGIKTFSSDPRSGQFTQKHYLVSPRVNMMVIG